METMVASSVVMWKLGAALSALFARPKMTLASGHSRYSSLIGCLDLSFIMVLYLPYASEQAHQL